MMEKFLTFIKKKPVIITAAAVVVVAVAVTCGVVAAVNGRENQPEVKSRPADTGEISSEASEDSGVSTEETSVEAETSMTGAEESTAPQNTEDPAEPDEPEAPEEPATSAEPECNAWLEGYVPTHPEPGELDEAMKNEIYKLWENYSEIAIKDFYGFYNGYAIVRFNTGGYTMISQETFDDVILYYSDTGKRLWAYKDGNMYTLKSLYSEDKLTKSDIQDIGYYSGAAWRVYSNGLELN